MMSGRRGEMGKRLDIRVEVLAGRWSGKQGIPIEKKRGNDKSGEKPKILMESRLAGGNGKCGIEKESKQVHDLTTMRLTCRRD